MGTNFALTVVDNIRPTIDIENTEPARTAIHETFMEHVMSHAPGYLKLMKWTEVPIMPTPAGEGIAMQLIADNYKKNVLGVGLGGATTNVYSVFDGRFVRSVSANLGMSYSITNVLKETGLQNIRRWIPFNLEEEDLANTLSNKMIRPTTIPQAFTSLLVEHAVAREALRLGLLHHKSIATRLKGVSQARTVGDVFQDKIADSYIDMMKIDVIAGTGGLLSHAPKKSQSLQILTDAWQPEGITWVFQDSVFMMPHLGVLSTAYREAAWNIFDKDCLIRVGTIIAPKGTGELGEEVMNVEIEMPDGNTIIEEVNFGDMKKVDLEEGKEAKTTITPRRGIDLGEGPGQTVEGVLMGGVGGIIIDARGRPIYLPDSEDARKELLLNWWSSLDLYDKDKLGELI
jgi:hypothetical protein